MVVYLYIIQNYTLNLSSHSRSIRDSDYDYGIFDNNSKVYKVQIKLNKKCICYILKIEVRIISILKHRKLQVRSMLQWNIKRPSMTVLSILRRNAKFISKESSSPELPRIPASIMSCAAACGGQSLLANTSNSVNFSILSDIFFTLSGALASSTSL